MIFTIEETPSDSPFVERIWRAHSERDGMFLSIAMSHWEMVVTRNLGKTTLTVRGPETKATPLYCPAGGEWLGIRFKLGTLLPHLPASNLVDEAVNLPGAGSRSFWLQNSAWQFPDFENADAFVELLVRKGLLVRDPVVDAALQGQLVDLSSRTVQRHFQRTTGLTQASNRTRQTCNGALAGRCVSRRHCRGGRLFRPAASHSIAEVLHRTNPKAD